MSSLRTIFVGVGMLGAFVLVSSGCEEKPKPETSSTAPKPDDEPAILDPNLGKVIAASSASAARAAQPAPDQQDGPPATGVFTPERAQAVHALGAPVSIEIGSQGSEPRVSLTPSQDEVPKRLGLTVATQMGPRRSLPTVDLSFGLKADKPKKEGDAGAVMPLAVTSKLDKVALSPNQPGQIPEEVEKEVVKMKGSKLSWTFAPGGGITTITLERNDKARAELEHNLVAIVEALAVASLPAPDKPVGAGAAWVARSRDTYGGLDLISYRMFRVTKVDGDQVTVAVETRQYATSPKVNKAGLPEGAELLQLECTGTGELVIERGARMAKQGTFTHSMKMGIRPPDAAQNQVMPLILQSTVTFPTSS